MKVSKSTILTILGGLGVIATVAFAVKATNEAVSRLDNVYAKKEVDLDFDTLTPMEVVKEVWDCYIPTFVMGSATLTCIFGANVLNRKQQASIAGAYALANEAQKEYRKKVKELYGDKADIKVCEEIIKDHYHRDDIKFEDGEKYLFYDTMGFGYFESTVRKTVTDDGLECFILDIEPAST